MHGTSLRLRALPLALALTFAVAVAGRPAAAPVGAARTAAIRGQGATGIQILNRDALRSATLLADFHRPGPFHRTGIQVSRPAIPPGGSVNLYGPIPEFPYGLSGVHLGADRSIGAVVRTDWAETGAVLAYNAQRPATDIVLPLFVQRWHFEDGAIAVMSAADTDVDVDLTLYAADGTLARHETLRLRPHEPRIVPLHEAVPPGIGFVGWARLRSAAPIAAVGLVDVLTSYRFAHFKPAYAYEAVPAAALTTTLRAPLVRRTQARAGGPESVTTLWVTNPADVPVRVTVRLACSLGPCAGRTVSDGPYTLPAHAMRRFDPRTPGVLPPNAVAAATIEADGPIASVVVDSINDREFVAAHTALAADDAGHRVALLQMRRQYSAGRFTTAAAVQNVGPAPATVEIRFADEIGTPLRPCGAPCMVVLPPGGGHLFVPSAALDAMPVNSYGSAVVVSDQPIVAIIEDSSETGTSDALIHQGIPLGEALSIEPLLAPFFVYRFETAWHPSPVQRFFPWAGTGR